MSRKSSPRRLAANRRNALKSTGPRTPEGKAKSSGNAAIHGLSTLHRHPLPSGCFLAIEDEPAFKGLLDEYVATYHPRHRDELDLLTEAVYAKFRQTRLWLAESGQLETAIALHEREFRQKLPTAGAHGHLANGFAHSEQLVKLYLRYGHQLHRHYLRCPKELRDLQASRLPQPNSPIEANPTNGHPAAAPSALTPASDSQPNPAPLPAPAPPAPSPCAPSPDTPAEPPHSPRTPPSSGQL